VLLIRPTLFPDPGSMSFKLFYRSFAIGSEFRDLGFRGSK
jgi:hypothetical protein